MIDATLCILIRGDEIMLAMKKRGFGEGKFNGLGGKVGAGETVGNAMRRECFEEAGVKPTVYEEAAVFNFIFDGADRPEWNQRVHVYVCTEWLGEPTESEEMRPEWFGLDNIPYDRMWEDDRHWLPRVLEGKTLEGTFKFTGEKGDKVESFDIKETGKWR